MFSHELTAKLESAGLVAVLTIEAADDAIPAARALFSGGISVIELAFRTPCAAEAIRRIRKNIPEMTVGAGTILNPQQVEEAVAAGAAFGVAPGCNPRTIQAAQKCGLPFAPGVVTATDIEMAVENQCRLLKYFSAETSGGLAHLNSIATPFAHLGLRYIPLGGINAGNMATYLQSPLIACVGGSWLATPEVIQNKDWEIIRRNAEAAMTIVRATRQKYTVPIFHKNL